LPKRIKGFAFQPFQKDQDAIKGEEPRSRRSTPTSRYSPAEPRSTHLQQPRDLGKVPELAARHDISVTSAPGWTPIAAATSASRERHPARQPHSNVVRLIIGNEVVLRGDLAIEDSLRTCSTCAL